jgi:hypothetical protein
VKPSRATAKPKRKPRGYLRELAYELGHEAMARQEARRADPNYAPVRFSMSRPRPTMPAPFLTEGQRANRRDKARKIQKAEEAKRKAPLLAFIEERRKTRRGRPTDTAPISVPGLPQGGQGRLAVM